MCIDCVGIKYKIFFIIKNPTILISEILNLIFYFCVLISCGPHHPTSPEP